MQSPVSPARIDFAQLSERHIQPAEGTGTSPRHLDFTSEIGNPAGSTVVLGKKLRPAQLLARGAWVPQLENDYLAGSANS
jgi:hypothetical protein